MPIYHGTDLLTPILLDDSSSASSLSPVQFTLNGTYSATTYGVDGFSSVTVNVAPTYANLNIGPKVESQTFDSNGAGYDKVTVEAVTSDIDSNIMSSNIRKGISILGITGSYEGTDTSDATAEADKILDGYTAYINGSKVKGTMNNNAGMYDIYPSYESQDFKNGYYDAFVVHGDSNLLSSNIKKDVTIFGIVGTYAPSSDISSVNTQTKTVTPSESTQVITPDDNYLLSKVTVNAIDSSYVGSSISKNSASNITATYIDGKVKVTIPNGYYSSNVTKSYTDSDLKAENIKNGVEIFGITGTYSGSSTNNYFSVNSYSELTTASNGTTTTYKYDGNNDSFACYSFIDNRNNVISIRATCNSTEEYFNNSVIVTVSENTFTVNSTTPSISSLSIYVNPNTLVNTSGSNVSASSLYLKDNLYAAPYKIKFGDEISDCYINSSGTVSQYANMDIDDFNSDINGGFNELVLSYKLFTSTTSTSQTNFPATFSFTLYR